ncbi:MAG: type II toxin-antitoxin system VapC family toxin [Elainella sp.]
MRAILDTHTFLWFVNDSSQLSSTAKDLIESETNLWISIASLWEIAIKVSVGKLSLPRPLNDFISEHIQANEIDILTINISHLTKVSTLPFHHRDPFDRLLAAQALVEQVPLIGVDAVFDSYEVNRIW